ncbi:hypothetical protein BW247_13560 [Acidihalobacter ferrooxydans]|uniref:Crp/Fnr family transcriptional regulator n=2 Tax=Acidihalobacter ferrooxydans TaxID=1765967 RepID=A0A1P8ULK7_9GAMM|nr:hypothetical protein BW247_13560 [Acidihalobacter ferrooxydans]
MLRDGSVLAALDPQQIDRLVEHAKRRTLRRGDYLFHAGMPAAHFFLLRRGRMKLFLNSHRGEEKILGFVEPGETFAEGAAFMADEPRYPASAQALVASEVWAISTATLRALLRESHDTCLRMLARQTHRIQGLLVEVEALALESAHYRLIAYLLRQAPADDTVTLPATKTLIAAQLAIKPETLSRLLDRLQRRGLIEMHGRHVRLHNRQALLELALEPVLRS